MENAVLDLFSKKYWFPTVHKRFVVLRAGCINYRKLIFITFAFAIFLSPHLSQNINTAQVIDNYRLIGNALLLTPSIRMSIRLDCCQGNFQSHVAKKNKTTRTVYHKHHNIITIPAATKSYRVKNFMDTTCPVATENEDRGRKCK